MQEKVLKPHSLILDNRKKLSLTGVEDVSGFNEETVSLKTTAGGLIVKGSGLHIGRLDLDTGDVEIEGVINLLNYTDSKNDKGFIQRLLG
ncbi:MAG: sporulation protein YabP [Ruminococcus sp.]|nr:sporulation protein YabP [Ruminococcus sp.]